MGSPVCSLALLGVLRENGLGVSAWDFNPMLLGIINERNLTGLAP